MSEPESEMWLPTWKASDVEIKDSDLAYNGFYHIRRFQLRHKCFSGEWSPWLTREQIRRADAAAALLFDPQHDTFVLVEQFRVGVVNVYPHPPWLLEIIAGLLEPGEEPIAAIQREAQEEAGCHIDHLIKIGDYYNSPGGFAEKTTLFLGLVDSANVAGVYGVGSEHEDIRAHVLPAEMILNALEKGEIMTSSSTVIALQWFALQREKGHFGKK